MENSENVNLTRSNQKTICNGSESSLEMKFGACKCNNNIGDCDFGVNDREIRVNCVCLKENRQNDSNVSVKNYKELNKLPGVVKRKSSLQGNMPGETNEKVEELNKISEENKYCGLSGDQKLSSVGGDGEEKRLERSECQQHELNPSIEINRTDVIKSCDLTSNSVIKSKSDSCDEENRKVNKDCPRVRNNSCSVFPSTCSEGSYSRRKHHKHHKHKKRNKSPNPPEESDTVSPKVNPIFLWVRQEGTKILEVLCEDYDHRNRLRITKTHLGWRAIPKTKTFAEAIIPKAATKECEKETKLTVKPKHSKKLKKKKKNKRKKEQKVTLDNPNQIKECSVALCRDDLAKYKALISNSSEEFEEEDPYSEKFLEEDPYLADTKHFQRLNHSRSSSPKSISKLNKSLSRLATIPKSNSCEFASLKTSLQNFPRSASLDLKHPRKNVEFKSYKKENKLSNLVKNKTDDNKSECGVAEAPLNEFQSDSLSKTVNQRDHSKPVVVDMTKHDLDFNDADCDELGQLLKDIPDLAFVEEEELEEIDEDEEWLKPTDLTVNKSSSEVKLPPSIAQAVTVTSSTKPPEPLAPPLPEVTITPISKPKPAHQQKSQNNFLENLLASTRSVKIENNDLKRTSKPVTFPPGDKKTQKHFSESDIDIEVKNKKLKVEDITLKNLLSKNQSGKSLKSLNVENCIKKLKTVEGEENSRLKELLSDSNNSDPITQLKEVLSNPLFSVPDPLLVPRARLPALVASPASEIPRLLSMHLEKTVEETPCPPMTDSDVLEVSLSNLQSLLSCSPEKLINANSQDLAKYQKTLETFLEWQRYQSELMENQMKSSKSMIPGFNGDVSDVAAATAFSQMLWLPYLNQFDFNCNNNREFMSLNNSMLSNEFQANCNKLTAPPHINTNQVSQPSPFLTPTSPMEFESHLKTLAMWQEALMMQQNSQYGRACSKVSPPNHSDIRRSGKYPTAPSLNKKANSDVQGRRTNSVSPISSKVDPLQNMHTPFDMYQDVYHNEHFKRQNRPNTFMQKLEHHNQSESPKCKSDFQNQFKKMQQSYANYQAELLKQNRVNDKHTKKPVPGCISVKPLSNLLEKNVDSKNSWKNSDEDSKKNLDFTSQVASKLMQFNTEIQKTTRKEVKEEVIETKPEVKRLTETPKIKVKNLVDPNMSPPKLLKQIAPEHLNIIMEKEGNGQEDGQANLWHPLFGSNQIKLPPYNSPWSWTTVTVNGE